MEIEEFKYSIVDEIDNIIYVVDLNDYNMLYMNKAAMKDVHIDDEREWKGRPCYEVLYNRERLCSDCANGKVLKDGACTVETYDLHFDRFIYKKQTKKIIDGCPVKIVAATDRLMYKDKQKYYSTREARGVGGPLGL